MDEIEITKRTKWLKAFQDDVGAAGVLDTLRVLAEKHGCCFVVFAATCDEEDIGGGPGADFVVYPCGIEAHALSHAAAARQCAVQHFREQAEELASAPRDGAGGKVN